VATFEVMLAPLAAAAIAGCPVFGADNPWNQRVDGLRVHPRSDAIVRSIGVGDPVHPDFGAGRWQGRPIGIPITVVGRDAKRVRVRFEYAGESDRGPYPIPASPRIEGGSDRHVVLVQRGSCRLFELFAAERSGGAWRAGSGAIWDLRSNRLRPRGWTSADAAGLPILPGLARYEEVARGEIRHALRFTAARTRRAFVWPARHHASSLTDPDLPAMGQRLRLKRAVDVSRLPRQARVIATALQRYGMLLADNGSDWFSPVPPTRAGTTTTCERSSGCAAATSRS
jgi:hypothetical protein